VKGRQGHDHAVILDDRSIAGRPEQWGAQVVAAWKAYDAEAVYVERNQGGDMTRATIHAVDPTCPVIKINADESKADRAEPIAALDEKGWIHHAGFFPMLESQMVTWVPGEGKSPDRVDARVHLIRALLKAEPLKQAKVESPVAKRALPRRPYGAPRPG
jgi:phage terminase large subunit-like protein